MKIQSTFGLILGLGLMSQGAFATNRKTASYQPGSKCGLSDTWGDEGWTSQTAFDLSGTKKGLVKSLPKTVKGQLIETANDNQTTRHISNVVDAVQQLREWSEAQELYVLPSEFKGKKYSVISYYGGGNHTGLIFAWGSTKPVAEIGDDDISCR